MKFFLFSFFLFEQGLSHGKNEIHIPSVEVVKMEYWCYKNMLVSVCRILTFYKGVQSFRSKCPQKENDNVVLLIDKDTAEKVVEQLTSVDDIV